MTESRLVGLAADNLVYHLTGSAFLPGVIGFVGQNPFFSYITFAALSL